MISVFNNYFGGFNMLDFNYDYQQCVANSEKISWKLDEVIPKDTKLDFTKTFLPSGLFYSDSLNFLNNDEKLKLNQIMGNSYLNLFHFVEEYIIAETIEHAQGEMFSGNSSNMRALLRFSDEEIKHQLLFERYRELFQLNFGSVPKVLEGAVQVAGIILSKNPLAVVAVTLHLEIITQFHYTESVKGNTEIDPTFSRVLKYHWLEEAQHAKVDALELRKLVLNADMKQIEQMFDDYLFIIQAFDGLLTSQAEMDFESLSERFKKQFSEIEKEKIIASQLKSYRNDFIICGLNNEMFMNIMKEISSESFNKIIALKNQYLEKN